MVKTSYLTQITAPEDKGVEHPIGFGSGFIVRHNSNEQFFVTADHTIHPDDSDGEIEQRTWKDYTISVFTNYVDPANPLSTPIIPLGGFYYAEEFDLLKPEKMPRLVDVSLCKLKDINLQYPFLTDEVSFLNGELIKAGENKFAIMEECFAEPNVDKEYFVFGKVRAKLIDVIPMQWENTIKEDIKFISQAGDYLLFNAPAIITDKADWKGLSGSPVLSKEGYCVGVLCDVLENSSSVWVMPFILLKGCSRLQFRRRQLT